MRRTRERGTPGGLRGARVRRSRKPGQRMPTVLRSRAAPPRDHRRRVKRWIRTRTTRRLCSSKQGRTGNPGAITDAAGSLTDVTRMGAGQANSTITSRSRASPRSSRRFSRPSAQARPGSCPEHGHRGRRVEEIRRHGVHTVPRLWALPAGGGRQRLRAELEGVGSHPRGRRLQERHGGDRGTRPEGAAGPGFRDHARGGATPEEFEELTPLGGTLARLLHTSSPTPAP